MCSRARPSPLALYDHLAETIIMRSAIQRSVCCVVFLSAFQLLAGSKGTLLENLTWIEAEKVLTADTVVVIPLGAESKEHGPHLKLKNDWLIAEYLKKRVLQSSNVVVAPTINYSFYPAFVEYPGSTSLRFETARDEVVDICRSLARFGPKRFYVLNTGISTLRPLAAASEILRVDGILLRYTNLNVTEPVEKQIRKEEGGTHAEEIETSMMLYIAPESVDMKKAVSDYHPSKEGGLTRDPNGKGTYSPSGVWGDATLATREKGRIVVEVLVKSILTEIEQLRSAAVPVR
jgi:creatinine amidohydrolase